MLAIAALAFAVTALPDGRRLALGETCYAIRTEKDGVQRVVGSVFQSVRRRKVGSRDALLIVIHQRLANGTFEMRDEFLVRRRDLRPIRLDSSRDGAARVHLDYEQNRVSGWKIDRGAKTAIATELPAMVWDGNLWGLTFAALPARPDAKYRLTIYQYDQGLGEFTVQVKGTRQVTLAGRKVGAWVLDAGATLDRRLEYLVSGGQELGYQAGGMTQSRGGDCSGLT